MAQPQLDKLTQSLTGLIMASPSRVLLRQYARELIMKLNQPNYPSDYGKPAFTSCAADWLGSLSEDGLAEVWKWCQDNQGWDACPSVLVDYLISLKATDGRPTDADKIKALAEELNVISARLSLVTVKLSTLLSTQGHEAL